MTLEWEDFVLVFADIKKEVLKEVIKNKLLKNCVNINNKLIRDSIN